MQTSLNHTADNTKIGFQILKQIIVTGSQILTVCKAIW